ncbi:MAG: hypothetical protein QOG44_659 [Acidimicrobiaceae bacterium]|nr:hypothetical protein [Acidimicrobiaceae bacterium]MDQ1441909.1 hypothetical protein [Acidimicrobiaceae bacterium]
MIVGTGSVVAVVVVGEVERGDCGDVVGGGGGGGGEVEPWRVSEHGGSVEPRPAELAVVGLDVDVIRSASAAGGAALGVAGPLRLGVLGSPALGRQWLKGRLVFEGHIGPGGVNFDEIRCTGTVRRVRRVPLHLPTAPRHPVGPGRPRSDRSARQPSTVTDPTYCQEQGHHGA